MAVKKGSSRASLAARSRPLNAPSAWSTLDPAPATHGVQAMAELPALPPYLERVPCFSSTLADVLDRATHAFLAKVTMGLSPASLLAACFDWPNDTGKMERMQ